MENAIIKAIEAAAGQTETLSEQLKEGLIFAVNKPYGWSSFDAVNKTRNTLSRLLKQRKVKLGHAGTLDPLATGVMLLCTGKACKRIEELQQLEKVYKTSLYLGASTPSYDQETEPEASYPTAHITEELLREKLLAFVGEIEQVPPIFSAVKVQGKRAYEYARKGEAVELKAKRIQIYEIDLLAYQHPQLDLRVRCGKGTYIRALARDIGTAVDSGAYLLSLQREQVGPYTLENAINITDIEHCFENSLQPI